MVGTQAKAQQLPRSEIRFSRKTVREATGWSDFQVKTHMQKLTELEYLLPHRGGRGQCFEYELLYDGDGGLAPHLSGLLDPEKLNYDGGKEPLKAYLEGSRSPQSGPKSALGSLAVSLEEGHAMDFAGQLPVHVTQTPVYRGNGKRPPSYVLPPLAAAEVAP